MTDNATLAAGLLRLASDLPDNVIKGIEDLIRDYERVKKLNKELLEAAKHMNEVFDRANGMAFPVNKGLNHERYRPTSTSNGRYGMGKEKGSEVVQCSEYSFGRRDAERFRVDARKSKT